MRMEVYAPGELSPGDGIEDDGPGLSVADLVRMFEESEESTSEARKESERDRDYVDDKQYTSAELATLKDRGQPPGMDNRIKSKIDYLVGLEKQQRVDPKAMPRTPVHEDDADGATEGLRYVSDDQRYNSKRSGVWRNLLVEGAGGLGVAVAPSRYGGSRPGMPEQPGLEIVIRRVPWDRMFWDPHSAEPDFSDAGYLGVVVWMDYADALAQYPDSKDILDTTLSNSPSDTYDDKPKFALWADKKRKRVRICQIWIRRSDQWHFAEFTKGGILKAGPSPYVTDQGESDCELFFQSGYVDRDNNRYGLVREMIPLQDSVNKRNSKSLHLLSVTRVIAEDGAVPDVELARREVVRPDGWVVVNPGMSDKIKVETQSDLAMAHFQLLQEAKNSIDLKGPNATSMGDKAQGSAAASGKAIIASQQGGMISLGDLLDNLRDLDQRVFRAVWARIRQFWTQEKWIRVTDDERNIKWVVMNADPEQLQMMAAQDPAMAQKIAGVVSNVAELDCDIIIEPVPDVIASQEQFANLVELKRYDTNNELPFRALVVASSIKDKSKMLEEMDKATQPNQQAQQASQLQMRAAAAEIFETEKSGELKAAQTQKTLVEAQLAPAKAADEAARAERDRQERIAMKGADIQDRAQDRDARGQSEMMRARLQAQRAQQPAA